MFRSNTLKQLYTLTSIDTFISLDGLEATHQTAGFDPVSDKDFYVGVFGLLLLEFVTIIIM